MQHTLKPDALGTLDGNSRTRYEKTFYQNHSLIGSENASKCSLNTLGSQLLFMLASLAVFDNPSFRHFVRRMLLWHGSLYETHATAFILPN